MKLLLLFLISTSGYSLELAPFYSDGCTFFSEGNKRYDWSECCLKHDIDYYFGGTRKRRRQVDRELKTCVKNKANKTLAFIMHTGVSLGHLSPIKSKYAWNKAWNKSREKNSDEFSFYEQVLMFNRMSESDVDKEIWLPLYQRLISQ